MAIRYIKIAIDGPAASGKSTVAKLVAKEFDYTYIDTGSMYRAITLKAIRLNKDLEDEASFGFVKDTSFEFKDGHLFMDDEDVNGEIRTHKISNNVSVVSSYLSVRQECVTIQREIAKTENIVMDGRDIGTVVLQDADFKFYLTASIETRANRRYEDNLKRGIKSDINILREKIAARDAFDSSREHSPLKPAEDAIIIDTSDLDISQVVALITNRIRGNSHGI
jgi:cytidylate kinase